MEDSDEDFQKLMKSRSIARKLLEKFWEISPLKDAWAKVIKSFLTDRSIAVFGDYKEEGDGWTKIEYLARLLANEKKYGVLTGKGLFIPTDSDVQFIPFIFDPSPYLVSFKNYSQWLVSLTQKSIILLGGLSSTVEDEENEAINRGNQVCGLAVIEKISEKSNNCSKLQTYGNKLSFCINGVGICEQDRYCPFAAKGLSGGRLDLYCRNENAYLLAVPRKEDMLDGLKFIGFV